MATTETPPTRPADSGSDNHEVPVLLVQLQDDLARSRMREAFWMSLFFHLLIAVLLATSPKWFPSFAHQQVVVASPSDLIDQRELTYLDLPPDLQKPKERPNTNIISDKDRIAESRQPTLDRKELRRILDSARPGAPGAGGIPGPRVAPSPAPQMAQSQPGQQAQNPAQQQGQGQSGPAPSNQMAKLETPPQPKPGGGVFGSAGMSPGKMIEQAARAAAASPGGAFGGSGGDYGLGPGNIRRNVGNMEVLSDTMGVDFGPYLSRVLHDVKMNWYNLIPEVARPPLLKRGRVSIEFAIMKDGSVAGMRLVSGSGDVSLDRAAWGGITASNRFPPLPNEFRGNYLALRFHFFYNPDKNDLQ
jgi:TonB family protein